MEIVESSKKFGSGLEQMVEKGIEKGKEVLSNVASHLPFANLAKDGQDTFTIEIDLPGVQKQDIDINVKGRHLNVSGVRKMRSEVKEEDYYLKESFYGKIGRTFILPDDLDTNHIDAEYKDGRLTITVRKIESAKGRSITID
jgi:HSP20 family protein